MPTLKVSKEFKFEAAHFLPKYHGKCERMHGHSYRFIITVEGELDPESGMVIDFLILKKIVKERVLSKVDHYCLNDFIENPTAENTAIWIWDQLSDLQTLLEKEGESEELPEEVERLMRNDDLMSASVPPKKHIPKNIKLVEVKLWETKTSGVTYSGK